SPTRMPQIEVAVGDALTVLVLRVLEPLTQADRELLLQFERSHEVRILLQAGRPDQLEPVAGERPKLWYGLPQHAVKLAFEPADFVQVNGPMNELLIDRVLTLRGQEAARGTLGPVCGAAP